MTSAYENPPQSTTIFRRLSWSAIFAGVIITVVVQILFTLLGVGIGAATIEPLQQAQPGKGLGIGAAIWLFITTLISIFIGARLAANLSGTAPRQDRMLHGLLTWGLMTVLSLGFLATTAGALLGGAGSLIGGAAAMTNRNEPAYATTSSGYGAANSPGGQQTAQGSSAPNQRYDQNAQAAQTEQRAREAGDVAAKRVSQAALWSFFVLLLSGIVAALAGRASTPGVSQRFRGAYGGTEPAKA